MTIAIGSGIEDFVDWIEHMTGEFNSIESSNLNIYYSSFIFFDLSPRRS